MVERRGGVPGVRPELPRRERRRGGDLAGLVSKLDYLNDGDPSTDADLGVDAIWLMPINPSPSYHGYDVTDYYGINPQYGTPSDFDRLIQECHKRGIKVVLDWVPNHTSSQHPWFKDAETSPQAAHRDWYVWSPTDLSWPKPFGQGDTSARRGAAPTTTACSRAGCRT